MEYTKIARVLLMRYRNEIQDKCREIGVTIECLQSELQKLKSKEREIYTVIEGLRNDD